MIYLLQNIQESPDRLRVGVIHFKPELLTKAAKVGGIELALDEASLPKPTEQEGKTSVLYVNPKTKALWYEYVDRPLTQDELMAKLLARMDTLITQQEELIRLLTPPTEVKG